VIAAVDQAARDEAQAGARKLAAIAELVHRTVDEDDEYGGWDLYPLVDRVENSQGLFERLRRYTSLRPERMVEPEDKE
jgi:hypothetical protein